MPDRNTLLTTAYLFYSNLTILFVGMGLFPLLPVYAAQFGASRPFIGLYFAIIYVSLSAGSLLSGALAARYPIKILFVTAGAIGVPALIALGQANHLWQVVLLTSVVWFSGGLSLAFISMLVGLTSAKGKHGRAFTLLSLTVPLGALFGGAAVGRLVADLGYGWMFFGLGVVWAGQPLVGLFFPELAKDSGSLPAGQTQNYKMYNLSEPFMGVLMISLVSAVAISLARLGAPLSMQAQAFTAPDIASTATISGLVALPIVALAGFFSDRIGRSRFLIIAYLSAATGIIVLSLAGQLWHFWLAASLILIALCLNGALASAVAADVLPPGELKRGLAWLNGILPIASILAYASTGFLTEALSFRLLFLLTAMLPVLAAALLESALQRCRRAARRTTPELILQTDLGEDNAYIKRCL
jgi:MFS family permease